MKIRGITVGTPTSPERILCTPQELTEAQKAQARKNIGAAAIGEGGGGVAPLIVIYDPQDGKASHTSTEIFEASLQRPVLLDHHYNFERYQLNYCNKFRASFVKLGDDRHLEEWVVDEDGDVEYFDHGFVANSEQLENAIGKADGALLYTQQELTEEQQAQARKNINAASGDIVSDEIEPGSANLYDKDQPAENNKLILPDGSVITSSGAVYRTVKVQTGKTYIFPIVYGYFGSANAYKIPCYDADGTYLGKLTGTPNSDNTLLTLTITDSFSKPTASVKVNATRSTADIYSAGNFMFVEGTEYPSEYIPYAEATSIPVLGLDLATDYVQNLLNPLYKKTIIWDGDSICAGKAFDDEGDAWAGRIADRNGMTYKNYAVGGGTITENVTAGGTVKHSVSNTIDTMYAEYPDADYIIFEGGTNDADLLGSSLNGTTPEFGRFDNADFSGNYDRNTFCGALESIFYRATNYWKGKKIGFIVAHKMGRTSGGYTAETNNRRSYFETAMQICEKWGIPVLNLWDGCPLNPSLPHLYTNGATWEENQAAGNFYADGQHLLSAGYNYEADIVNSWLKTL